jgi:hypothetical protein
MKHSPTVSKEFVSTGPGAGYYDEAEVPRCVVCGVEVSTVEELRAGDCPARVREIPIGEYLEYARQGMRTGRPHVLRTGKKG